MTLSIGNDFRVTGPLYGNSPITGELPSQRPVTRSFDVFFALRLKKGLIHTREAGDLRRHRTHYDVTVVISHDLRLTITLVCILFVKIIIHLPIIILSSIVERLLGPDSIKRCHLTSIGNPIVEIRRSYDRLISTMGSPIPVRQHLYIESGPWSAVQYMISVRNTS